MKNPRDYYLEKTNDIYIFPVFTRLTRFIIIISEFS